MKIVAAILIFVGFTVIIDAKAVCKLPNGGQIISPDGKYIPGKFGLALLKFIELELLSSDHTTNGWFARGRFFFAIHWYRVIRLNLIYFFEFVGIIPRIFGPIFENLKKQSGKCSVGYVQIMLNLMIDTDSALATNNGSNLRLLFKTFAGLFEMQLPFIHNKRLHDTFVQCVEGNKQGEARQSNGSINLCEVNQFFTKASNSLNDSL